MYKRLICLLLLVFSFQLTVYAKYTDEIVKVTRVIDGDTIEVIYQGEVEKVRLYGIDTPERGEFGFERARDVMRLLCSNSENKVKLIFPKTLKNKRDHFGRLLVNLYISSDQNYSENGSWDICINEYMEDEELTKISLNSKLEPSYLLSKSESIELIINLLKHDSVNEIKDICDKINIEEKNILLNTALRCSYQVDSTITLATLNELVRLGANINCVGENNSTPLHLAVQNSIKYEYVVFLLSYGVNINARDSFGKTPLDYAIKYKAYKIINLLINNGATTSVQQN